MNLSRPTASFLALLLISVPFAAEGRSVKRYVERFDQTFPLSSNGTLILSNNVGRVEIIGSPVTAMVLQATRVTEAFEDEAIAEAIARNQIIIGGDPSNRIVKSFGIPERTGRWNTVIDYVIRVPRTVQVRIFSQISERIGVSNIVGTVFVKNTSGVIQLTAPLGATTVDTINGNILADYPSKPTANTSLRTVNGRIDLRVPLGSAFGWLAETLKGDILTTVPAQGQFDPSNSGTMFRGVVNGPGGPTIETSTMTGQVFLVAEGHTAEQAKSLIGAMTRYIQVPPSGGFTSQLNMNAQRTVRLGAVAGNYEFQTTLGSVSVREILGTARISTRAGEIALGRVAGWADLTSLGGPLNLGEVDGDLKARTAGGDIFIRAAKKGGDVYTEGGNVQLIFAGGPVTLRSGGGDILLRQASGPVRAETKSGDITINMDPNLKTQRVWARTEGGNVTINVPPQFGANVDATILSDDPSENFIRSDVAGLSISRDRVGNKTRIRAVGKINGGGEKLELRAENGDIRIISQLVPRIVIIPSQ